MQITDLGHGRGWLNAPAAASLRRVDAQIGHPLQITEAGRTPAQQQVHWDRYQRYLNGGPWAPLAARPGTSPHEFGNAIDTDERLVAVLAEHGWWRPLASEPWHFVYRAWADKHINDPAPSPVPIPIPEPTQEDEMIFINIKGKAGARRGGCYAIMRDNDGNLFARHIGAPLPTAPTAEDERSIAELQASIPGLA